MKNEEVVSPCFGVKLRIIVSFGFCDLIGHPLDANIASLRRLVFKFKFSSNFKTNTESLVETQCLRLRDAQSNHKTKNLTTIR
jgi:hypothetical protein